MDDQEFFAKLASLDKDMADRWKNATRGSLKATIGTDAINSIVPLLFKDKKLTSSQAQALAMMYYTELTPDGADLLRAYVNFAYDNDLFFKGSAKTLVTNEELQPLDAALGMANVGKINFTSPETKLTYTPDLYGAIRWLVHDKQIAVFEVDAGELLAREGNYRSDINRLVLYAERKPVAGVRTMSIVHEVTHAIQDWKNIKSRCKFLEADAYIAGAVAALGVNDKFSYLEYKPALETAARLVLDGKATRANAAWINAYADVVKGVRADPTYSHPDATYDMAAKEKGRSESDRFTEALKRFKADPVLNRN